MKNKIQKIGILTSGGDGPGMNAAIRSVTRYALRHNLKVAGVLKGYDGLIDDEIVELNHRSVSGIINRGGTILKTARSKRFLTKKGQKRAVATMLKNGIDALVVIGGDGSYRGANDLYKIWKFPTVGLPGTIDNDLCGTDQTIGCHTAVNTALDAIDKIRDTAHSMERIFVVEVMGRSSGYIAMQVAIGAGAEDVIIPGWKFNYEKMYEEMVEGNLKGKISWIVVVAEGAGKAHEVAARITRVTGLESRFVVLGHVQRGGTPTATDRILATRLGAEAVHLLMKGVYGKAIGVLQDKINVVSFEAACKHKVMPFKENYRLIKYLI